MEGLRLWPANKIAFVNKNTILGDLIKRRCFITTGPISGSIRGKDWSFGQWQKRILARSGSRSGFILGFGNLYLRGILK